MTGKLLSIAFFLVFTGVLAQKQVAVTMDDIEIGNSYLPEDYKAAMLDTIVSMNIPVAILISEGRLYKHDVQKHMQNIERWISNPLITPGSHTYSHLYYSDTTFGFYTRDIEKGLSISVPLARKYGKEIRYFRFPFNCLGKDSAQHVQMRRYIEDQELVVAPFTVESEDWAYNVIYEYYLSEGDTAKARQTGERYVSQTLAMFAYIGEICRNFYGRDVNQIYLCHDHVINEHYLPKIVSELKRSGYAFVTLAEAMKDPVFLSEDRYYRKWGISWIYRYNYASLQKYMKEEPYDNAYPEYEEIIKRKPVSE